MNIRSVEIPQIPMASTAMVYNRISMPCAPWEQPDPPRRVSQPAPPARTLTMENLEERIMSALKAGLTRQREILGGRVSGPMEDKARLIFNNLLETGRATRTRDRDGYIWRLQHD